MSSSVITAIFQVIVSLVLLLTLSSAVMSAPDGLDKPLTRVARFIPSSSRSPFANLLASRASFLSTGHYPSSAASVDIGRPKRALFDDSCKGVYDRELFGKLDRVCEDCYNLYRKTSVSYECRRNCFQSVVFQQCVLSLLLPLRSYASYAHTLYTKQHDYHDFAYSTKQQNNHDATTHSSKQQPNENSLSLKQPTTSAKRSRNHRHKNTWYSHDMINSQSHHHDQSSKNSINDVVDIYN